MLFIIWFFFFKLKLPSHPSRGEDVLWERTPAGETHSPQVLAPVRNFSHRLGQEWPWHCPGWSGWAKVTFARASWGRVHGALSEPLSASFRGWGEEHSRFCWGTGSSITEVVCILASYFSLPDGGCPSCLPHPATHTFLTQPRGPCPVHVSTAGLSLAGLPAAMTVACWQAA